MLTIEPPLLTGELSPPTREPLAPAIEPLLPSAAAPLPITAPVYRLPDRREKRWGPAWMGLAAAALVLVTAGITSFLTVEWVGRARTPNVASDTGARRPSASEGSSKPGIRAPSVGREQLASAPAPALGRLGSALTVATTSAPSGTRSPEEVVYDKEINMLQRVARRQKADLDASTVAVIEKNLRTVDSAIAQIRAALEKDPESPILGGQASRALEMKVELLR
ncbi:MAG: hypothetical protein M3037_06415, partial [Gemmatimonadota bacterium]|nr:hypothetical protein [Gemmatimonadota bacterium]